MFDRMQRRIQELNVNAQKRGSMLDFVFSSHFVAILLLGQFLAFCITSTTVASTELAVNHNFNAPTTQNSLNYIVLAIIYTSYTIYKRGFRYWVDVMLSRGWKYFILAIFDVEGNYFAVKAFQYTSLLTIILLDAWAIPVCMALSFAFLKVRYHWSQLLGSVVVIGGVSVLVAGDLIMRKDEVTAYTNEVKGIIFCFIFATCYGISNFIEELFCRQYPLDEVIGQMGVWGTIVNTIQLVILERQELRDTEWNSAQIGLLVAYNVAMFALYTGAPILFRWSSSAFFNLSLQTSDFYSLVIGLRLYHLRFHALYPLAFCLSILGMIIYYVYPATLPKIAAKEDDDTRNETVGDKNDGGEYNPQEKNEDVEQNNQNRLVV